MRINRREFGASMLGALGRRAAGQEPQDQLMDRVATGFRFTEGPAWSREGFLLFSDVPNDKIMKYVPGQKPTVFRENSNGATVIASMRRGDFIPARAARAAWFAWTRRATCRCWPRSGTASV